MSENSLVLLTNSSNLTGCQDYENIDTNFFNYIELTEIDSIDLVIKGEFQFSIINQCQDTIRVTEGYFDLNYFF